MHYLLHASILPNYFWHPLGYCPAGPTQIACKGYNIWSGILGSFLTSLPGWIVALGLWYRHNNCKKKGCPFLGHKHPEHGFPMCPIHHMHTPSKLVKHHNLHSHWHHAKKEIQLRNNGD